MKTNPPNDLICIGCGKRPYEIEEYIMAGRETDLTPTEYVQMEEGTLNHENGHFLCTDCWIKAGMPSSPTGWVAP